MPPSGTMHVRAPVAQWIERSRPKAGVGGSNPSGGASSPHQRVLANQTACQASRGRREGESLASGDERLRSMAPGDTARLYHRLSSYAGALTTSGRRRSTIRWYGRTSPPITARRSRPIARSIPTAPGGEAATGAIDVAPAGVDRTSAPSSPQASDRRTAVRSRSLGPCLPTEPTMRTDHERARRRSAVAPRMVKSQEVAGNRPPRAMRTRRTAVD
jgi:hypothetical protein